LYTGPKDQGLFASMAYLIDFYTQYSDKILNANYSNPVVAKAMAADTGPATFTNGMIVYLNPLLEYITLEFYNDAINFFTVVKQIVYGVSFSFVFVFVVIYLSIFITFIRSLNHEIKQTHDILNMIPLFVLEKNPDVREQVWLHKGAN